MQKKKSRVGSIIVIAIVTAVALGLAIGLPFAIGLNYFNSNTTVGALYWTVKGLMCAFLLATAIWLMIVEREIPSVIMMAVTVTLLQGFAPLCRVAQHCGSFDAGFCGLILGLGVVIFAIMFVLSIRADKMQKNQPEYQAGEIKVKKERKGLIDPDEE